jgi:cellobiose epimerase
MMSSKTVNSNNYDDIRQLVDFAQTNLNSVILPYWLKHGPDKEFGGLIGEIDSDNNRVADAPKGLILNSRVVWTLSASYKLIKDPALHIMASEIYQYLMEKFYDSGHQGFYWSLNQQGNPLETKKQTYAQAFTMYGLSEYYAAFGDKAALQTAIDLFHLMETHCLDKIHGGYYEAFTRNWSPIDDMRLSAKDMNVEKTMNTHLHVLEAYTSLYRVWKDASLEKALKSLLEVFDKYFVNHEDYHLNLFFDTQWNNMSSQISYGHDIEASWLMHESAVELEDQELIRKFEHIAVAMAHASREGLTREGSLIYEWHRGGKGEKDDELEWWAQAEAIVGFYNAWQISRDPVFLVDSIRLSKYISDHFINKEHGEWHFRVSANGVPIKKHPIAGFWKCPYHNARMCLELINRIQ